tara:strand:- start:50 stop:766 length:717 start_codon:yes stop_codon:yes gene_type:complete
MIKSIKKIPSNSQRAGGIAFANYNGEDRLYKKFGKKWKYVNLTDGDWNVSENLNVNKDINLSGKLIKKGYPAFRVYIDDTQSWATGGYSKVQFESKSHGYVVNEYDNNSDIDYTNDWFVTPYDGIYHFNTSILFEDFYSEEVDAGELISQILYIDSDGSGTYVEADDKVILIQLNAYHTDLIASKYWTAYMTTQTKLSAGDKVQWGVNNNCGATIEPYNSYTNDTKYNMFTGHLICAL